MNVVDSSAWLEYFSDGPNASFFGRAVEDTSRLLVPTICLYEVFKRVLEQRPENEALQVVAIMRQGLIVDLTDTIALSAAKVSRQEALPMADSIILATARTHKATIWTQDDDFKGRDRVKYRRRNS